MFHKLNGGKRYDFENDSYHFIITNQELCEDELKLLNQLLASFPYTLNCKWKDKFLNLNTEEFPKKILLLAANAYNGQGITVLGAAADAGGKEALQKLIDMGANLNACDAFKKLPLHWAISNNLSFRNENSLEAAGVVKCLLDNGARTDITCYQNATPLYYAQSRGFTAAANLIKEYMRAYLRGATIGLFKDTFSKEISGHISNFLSEEDNMNIALTRKDAYITAEMENILTMKKSF